MELIQFLLGLIFILFNEIFKFFRKRPVISLLFTFVLWVNSFPLHEKNTGRQDLPVERCFSNQKALGISGGDGLPIWFSAKREKFDLVLHARLMKTFPDWEARMNYQKKQEEFYKLAIKNKLNSKDLE